MSIAIGMLFIVTLPDALLYAGSVLAAVAFTFGVVAWVVRPADMADASLGAVRARRRKQLTPAASGDIPERLPSRASTTSDG